MKKPTYEELEFENRKYIYKMNLLENELAMAKAQMMASDAHCTIMTRAATQARSELQNHKKKTRQSVKTQARFASYPDLKAAYEIEAAEKEAAGREAAEKEAEKAAQEKIRLAQINEEIVLKVFTKSLSSYKWKDELITLAGALHLETTGTVPELTAQVKAHIEAHPELAETARFAGLFQCNRRARVEETPIQALSTSSVATVRSPDCPSQSVN
jgi:hypothetical protein